ncbi:MAG: aminodeoxychorismate synthase component I [Cyclobacteriaceae bacterium]|jgi:para-aminobenzoate synthetase component 1
MKDWRAAMNDYGRSRTPFFFLLDFELCRPRVFLLEEVANAGITYSFHSPVLLRPDLNAGITLTSPFPYEKYEQGFREVQKALSLGDSYLVNYTAKHGISLDNSLENTFEASRADYKLIDRDYGILVFSPECFVRTSGNEIFTFPMKGTISAAVPDAANVLLNDIKEKAEHVTIVDLLRNDLSRVAQQVRVDQFRYLQKIRTRTGDVWQTSSKISGNLDADWRNRIGDMLQVLLPAGSVSGAPKARTCEIIRSVEPDPRGYYCGVMGVFDGQNLDSAVMIRFIEKSEGGYYYRSGGGITLGSDCRKEYDETLTKVYVPVV